MPGDSAGTAAQRVGSTDAAGSLERQLVDNMVAGVWVLDAGHRTSFVNQAMARMLGYRPEEMLGRDVQAFVWDPERAEQAARLERRRAGVHELFERRYLRADGTPCWCLVSATARLDSRGGYAGSFAILVDINDRKQAEEALRQRTADYQFLADASLQLLSCTTVDQVFAFISASAPRLFPGTPVLVCRATADGNALDVIDVQGLTPERLQRYLDAGGVRLAGQRLPVSPEFRDRYRQPNLRSVTKLADFTSVFPATAERAALDVFGGHLVETIGLADGVRLYGTIHALPERPEEDHTLVEAFVRQCTSALSRIRAARGTLEMERRLLQAQKLESLGVLAGGIAHDFNNLLAAVLGNLEMVLLDLEGPSNLRAGVEEAVRAARRAADLTRQMLAYSGRSRFVAGPLSLNHVLEQNAELFRTSIGRSVSFRMHREPDLPLILADAGQVQQVVMNLITNAAEAIGDTPGVVTLTTGVEECGDERLAASLAEEKPPPGRFVFLEVADDGSGMDEDTRRRLFEPFFSTRFTGRGLGLPAVLGIVRGHRGAIFVDSSPGAGTRVRVLFPVAPPLPGGVAHVEPSRTETAGGPMAGTLLVADDDPAVLQLGKKMLERLGYQVLTATDGEQAVEVFRAHADEIRCVVLDLTMPRMDGVDACKALRRIRPNLPVVVASGYGEDTAAERFGGQAASAFIQKPFRLDTLRGTLETLLA